MQADEARSCFDAARAEYPTRVLPLTRVVDLLPVSHAPERIDEYRAAMQRGDRFPPIAVVRVGARFLVADGHKRLSAYAQLTDHDIVVQVWTLRRWLRDQRAQFVNKTRQQAGLLRRLRSDPQARREAARLWWDTVGHWQRLGRSLAAHWRALGTRSGSDPLRLFIRLLHDCLAYPWRLALAVVSLLVASGAQLYLTWLAKRWADGPLAGDDAAVAGLLFAGIAVTAVMVATLFVSRYVLNDVNQRMVQGLRDRALTRLLALRLPAAQALRSGELVSRIMTDAGVLSGFVRDILKRLLGEGLLIVGALAMAFYLDWRLALGTAALVPLVAVVIGGIGGVIRRRSAGAQAEIGDLAAVLNEQLHGLSTIKAFGAEADEAARFAARNRRYRRLVMRGEWWSNLLVTLVWIVTGVGLWGILWYGTRQVTTGQITTGGLMAFCLYLLQTLEPLRRLSDVQALLQRALAAASRIYAIIDSDDLDAGGRAVLRAPRGELRLDAVEFRYRPDTPVLDGLTLAIAPGEPLALVGGSGGGKSTLAKLLVRFHDPQRGGIRLDGIDLRGLALPSLRAAVCLVEQEPFLFSGRLLDNLRYGSPAAAPALVEEAVGLAGLEAVVRALPHGLDTAMDEAGRNLSVGQKQRIALARAIVRDPAVLILDEATSALDGDTERQIFAQLDAWLRRRTTIVIAHRFSTVSRFGRVAVLERGRVVGDGPLPALLDGCAAFRKLFAEQITAPRA